MKAKYKGFAKIIFEIRNQAFMLFIFKILFKFSLLNLVKDIWSKFLSIKVFPTHKMWGKCGINCTI